MLKKNDKKLSVAPMMDWTDRHCRYFHRVMSKRTRLYTEMVTAQAVVHGERAHLLRFDPSEHPVALQIGGSDPDLLARAVVIACDAGFDEINLNVGCPSDRVQSGSFGAVLMESPALVAKCAAAMINASDGAEITVKCRVGVDHQNPAEILPEFLETVSAAGVASFAIHARKAWLHGISPKDNREIPPLDHKLVLAMKAAFPELEIVINGGITSLDQAQEFLGDGLDGVMIGRAAYHDPASVLLDADRVVFGDDRVLSREAVVEGMLPYIARHLAGGGRLGHVTRHMLGLFCGLPGAKAWRRTLSESAHLPDAGTEHVMLALDAVAEVRAMDPARDQ